MQEMKLSLSHVQVLKNAPKQLSVKCSIKRYNQGYRGFVRLYNHGKLVKEEATITVRLHKEDAFHDAVEQGSTYLNEEQ